jgi:hypothetical protein
MGFNTTVVVHNDSLGTISKDPEFGKNLARAILSIGFRDDKCIGVSAHADNCVHCNAVEVIETHHADSVVAVAVGGNYGVEIGYAGGYKTMGSDVDSKIEMVRTLAENLGYTLRKKPKRKS